MYFWQNSVILGCKGPLVMLCDNAKFSTPFLVMCLRINFQNKKKPWLLSIWITPGFVAHMWSVTGSLYFIAGLSNEMALPSTWGQLWTHTQLQWAGGRPRGSGKSSDIFKPRTGFIEENLNNLDYCMGEIFLSIIIHLWVKKLHSKVF